MDVRRDQPEDPVARPLHKEPEFGRIVVVGTGDGLEGDGIELVALDDRKDDWGPGEAPVCSLEGDRVGRRELTENRLVRDCTGAAEEEAVYDVGHPMVLARYYGRAPEIYIDEDEDDVAYYPDGSVVVYDDSD